MSGVKVNTTLKMNTQYTQARFEPRFHRAQVYTNVTNNTLVSVNVGEIGITFS